MDMSVIYSQGTCRCPTVNIVFVFQSFFFPKFIIKNQKLPEFSIFNNSNSFETEVG